MLDTEFAVEVADVELSGGSSINLNFFATLQSYGFKDFKTSHIQDLQVNLGKLCNQACNHCHVDAGPKRTEIMAWETMEKILAWSAKHNLITADITGGAPELNPNFRSFVDGLIDCNMNVMSRCNLTVLFERGQEDLAEWYASRHVKIICSLPCYTKDNVELQRGKGIFEKSIRGLQLLNELGYGVNEDLPLDLVYNPAGAFLPPAQAELELQYKERLYDDFGIQFNQLYTITNLPISRFKHYLKRTGEYDNYLNLLYDNFNSETVNGLMCRHTLSVDWLGRVYDCDFNQMLGISAGFGPQKHVWDLTSEDLSYQPIAVGNHCYGCTAGSGSSCGGALV